MKLAKGVTVYHGQEKFTGEIPDEKAKALGLLKEKKEKPVKKEEIEE